MNNQVLLISMIIISEFFLILGIMPLLTHSKYKPISYTYYFPKIVRIFAWFLLIFAQISQLTLLRFIVVLLINIGYTFDSYLIYQYTSVKDSHNRLAYILLCGFYILLSSYFFIIQKYLVVSFLISNWLLMSWMIPLLVSLIRKSIDKKFYWLFLILVFALLFHLGKYYFIFTGRLINSNVFFTPFISNHTFPLLLVLSLGSYMVLIYRIGKENEENYQIMRFDHLTKSLNRGAFWHEFEIIAASDHGMSFAIIDIDSFKSINDTFGHPVGDQILENIPKIIHPLLPPDSIFGRVGGEEFAIIIRSNSLKYSYEIMDSIRVQVSNISIGELPPITLSIGLVICSSKTDAITYVYKVADHNLYTAKVNGKNRIVVSTIDK